MSEIRLAAAAWKLRPIRSDGDFYGHFHDLVTLAHDEGAEVIVFPEGQTLELVHLAPDLEERDVPAYLVQFADEIERWIDRISRSSGLTIIGGSHLKETEEGIKAVCAVGNGDDGVRLIEKAKLTPYEQNVWRLTPGRGASVLPDDRVGVTLGYDGEFPEAGRILANAGVVVHAFPALARNYRAFQRSRWSAHARTVENQNYVVHASLVGDLGRAPVAATFGSTAILTPSTEPFAVNAVLGETEYGEEDVVVRTLDLDAIAAARQSSGVSNWLDR